jgi:von Hippel-Lindau disease tumor suppressor protein
MPPISRARTLFLLAFAASIVLCRPALAADDMQWQFYESNEPDDNGAMTARLVYGVPETDNVQVMGVCDAGTNARVSSLTFGADTGDLANGAETQLRFSGGGFEQTHDGHIVRAEGEGLNGVQLDLKNDDPLWDAFADKDTLDYLVPGYRAATLDLADGRDSLKKFVEACRTYETAALGDADNEASGGEDSTAGDDAQKDAFDSAKELGTVAAFEAFLSNYPSGFYADLARAYVDKLKKAEAPSSAPESAPPPKPSPKPVAAPADPSCKDLFKIKSQGSDAKAKITFINKSGAYRGILWLDFSGQPKDYANLQAGEEITLDTFLTHPWMVTDGPGDCIEIFMPHAGTRVVTLKAPDGTEKAAAPPPPPPAKKASPPPQAEPKPTPKKAATPKCRSRSILVDGKCILRKNAAGYCGPGYRVKNGKCVPGAYVAPKPTRRSNNHGCPPGQVWSPQELCHYDD